MTKAKKLYEKLQELVLHIRNRLLIRLAGKSTIIINAEINGKDGIRLSRPRSLLVNCTIIGLPGCGITVVGDKDKSDVKA